LQWWAGSVLFAEVCELVCAQRTGQDVQSVYNVIAAKVDEFDRLVIQRQIEKNERIPEKRTLEERVSELEAEVFKDRDEDCK
jgi:hypothetical protein